MFKLITTIDGVTTTRVLTEDIDAGLEPLAAIAYDYLSVAPLIPWYVPGTTVRRVGDDYYVDETPIRLSQMMYHNTRPDPEVTAQFMPLWQHLSRFTARHPKLLFEPHCNDGDVVHVNASFLDSSLEHEFRIDVTATGIRVYAWRHGDQPLIDNLPFVGNECGIHKAIIDAIRQSTLLRYAKLGAELRTLTQRVEQHVAARGTPLYGKKTSLVEYARAYYADQDYQPGTPRVDALRRRYNRRRAALVLRLRDLQL